MNVAEAIRKRRSIRHFAPTPVSDDVLLQLLESARLAPSAVNKQPWRFVLVQDGARKESLVYACYGQRSIREAPVVFVCLVDLTPTNAPRIDAEAAAQAVGAVVPQSGVEVVGRPVRNHQKLTRETARLKDASIAIEHICLQAVELGLGTCWVGMFDEQMVKDIIKAPEDSKVAIILPVGYPAENPPPRLRLSLSQIAFREEYDRSWLPGENAILAGASAESRRVPDKLA